MIRLKAIVAHPSVSLFTLTGVTLVWVGADHGGYFPPVWGWTGLMFAWAAVVSFALRDGLAISGLESAFLGGLTLFTAWSAISLAWTPDVTVGVENVERDLMYIGAALVAVSLRDRLSTRALRNAILVASSIVCLYSLGTRLVPDRLGFYSDALTPGRLFNPLGYWNAQGLLAALSMLLAASVVGGRGRTLARSLTGGLVPLLALDCYFTLSRGALIALAIGMLAWLAIDPHRLRSSAWLLVLSPWPALAVWRAHSVTQLFGEAFGPQSAPAGHRLALQVAACTFGAAATIGALTLVEERLAVPRWAKRTYVASWLLAFILVVVLAVARYGTPAEMTHSVDDALAAPPPSGSKATRLLSLSLNGRPWLWSVAWDDAKANPIAGSGIGSYEHVWFRERPFPSDARWATSLYLETLAETGVIGLILLLTALATPIVAAIRRRSNPVVPALLGAYVAYVVHAGTDWDWQVPAATLAALWCGCALMAAEDGRSAIRLTGLNRTIAIAMAGAIGLLAVGGLVGNRDLALSRHAAARGAYTQASAYALAARRWEPWSYLPEMALGNARKAAGNIVGARAAYRRAVGRDASRWEPWLALAEVSTGSERKNALRQAARLDPLSIQIANDCAAHKVSGCRAKR